MSRKRQAKPRLTREDWIEAAFDKLTTSGVGEVAIDRLAKLLGVTRGSFYHHFGDRTELMQAVLAYWADRWTRLVRKSIEDLRLDPTTNLLALMRAIRSNGAADFDAPVRAWALHDPTAREVVQRVDEERLGFILEQFHALGFAGVDAENRARLYLGFEMSAPSMFAGPEPELDEQLLIERHRFLTTATAAS